MRYTYPRVIEVGGGSGSSPMKLKLPNFVRGVAGNGLDAGCLGLGYNCVPFA